MPKTYEGTFEPLLPMELEVLDAEAVFKAVSSGESIYITYSNGRYWVCSRFHSLAGTEWETHFEVTKLLAQKIVHRGYANWWITVDESVR